MPGSSMDHVPNEMNFRSMHGSPDTQPVDTEAGFDDPIQLEQNEMIRIASVEELAEMYENKFGEFSEESLKLISEKLGDNHS